MKLIAATLGFLIGTSAWACPDLEGRYICELEHFNRQIDITKTMDGDVEIYKFNQRPDMRTDGSITDYLYAEDEVMQKGMQRASCTKKALSLMVVAELLHFGETYEGDLRMTERLSLNDDNNLVYTQHAVYQFHNEEKPLVEQSTLTCIRQ